MKAVLILDVINKDNAIFDTIECAGTKYKIQEQMKIPITFSEIESEIGLKVVELKIIEKKGEQSHCFEVLDNDNNYVLPLQSKQFTIIHSSSPNGKEELHTLQFVEKLMF